jgi:hypothetical protein
LQNHQNEMKEVRKGIIGPSMSVVGVNKATGEEVSFVSATEASRSLGINNSHISACCRGNRNHADGFIWRYKV